MIGNNIAPGLNRHFLAMKWKFLDRSIWNSAVEEAMDSAYDNKLSISGYDINRKVISYAYL